jgi:hypothetical protein
LRHLIDVGDASLGIGRQYCIADTAQCDSEDLALLSHASFTNTRCFAENNDQRTSEEVCNQPDEICDITYVEMVARCNE